jgi:acyl-CoA thioester hydrolase
MDNIADQYAASETLREFPIVIRLPIQWSDLDVYGHVNNVVYLKWFEAARIAYATRVGVEVLARDHGVGAILMSVTCNYLRPLAYPGDVLSAVRITRLTIGAVHLKYVIANARTGVPVADGSSDAVLYDYAADRPISVPDHIRAAVESLEGKSFPA